MNRYKAMKWLYKWRTFHKLENDIRQIETQIGRINLYLQTRDEDSPVNISFRLKKGVELSVSVDQEDALVMIQYYKDKLSERLLFLENTFEAVWTDKSE